MSRVIHQELLGLRDRARAWLASGYAGEFDPLAGICDNLALARHRYEFLTGLMTRWPGFSGVRLFPVPHPLSHPATGFADSTADEMWDPLKEYARNRWALLDWLIEQTAPEQE